MYLQNAERSRSSSLLDRRMAARLTFFYKVVEGLVSAISPDAFLKLQRPKRQIHAKNVKAIDEMVGA